MLTDLNFDCVFSSSSYSGVCVLGLKCVLTTARNPDSKTFSGKQANNDHKALGALKEMLRNDLPHHNCCCCLLQG